MSVDKWDSSQVKNALDDTIKKVHVCVVRHQWLPLTKRGLGEAVYIHSFECSIAILVEVERSQDQRMLSVLATFGSTRAT